MGRNSYKWVVLGIVSITNLSAALDISIIVVSLPRLVEVFQTNASVVVWLIIAFTIAELGLLLTLARIGDSIGRKKVYMIGLVLYTIGLIFCSLSQNISQLIISRIIQGAGASMTLTIGGAIVIAAFPPKQQGRAIGIFSMAMSLGLITGPALGGFLLDFFDWRSIFYTRIPIGILSLILTAAIIQEQKESNTRLQLDIGGALTLLGGTGCLLLFLHLGGDLGYLSIYSIMLLLASIVLLCLFIYIEQRVEQPVLELKLFKSHVFTMANVANFVRTLASVSVPNLSPFLLISGLMLSPSTVGMLMGLLAIPALVLSPISGWLSDKIGNRVPMVTGMLLSTITLFIISRLDIDSNVHYIAIILFIFGCGTGFSIPPNQSSVVSAVPRKNLSTAIDIFNTMRLLGASIGTAFTGTFYAGQYLLNKSVFSTQYTDPKLVERLAVIYTFRFILLIVACISTISVIAAMFTNGGKSTN